MNTLITKNIQSLRSFLQISRPDFARAIGVSETLISLIESGKREPSAKFVKMVCDTFHLKLDTIYGVDLMASACNDTSPNSARKAI